MKKLFYLSILLALTISFSACGEIGPQNINSSSIVENNISSESESNKNNSNSNSINVNSNLNENESNKYSDPKNKSVIRIIPENISYQNVKNLPLMQEKNISGFICDNKKLYAEFSSPVACFIEENNNYQIQEDANRIVINSQYGSTKINIKFTRSQSSDVDATLKNYIHNFASGFDKAREGNQKNNYAYAVITPSTKMDDYTYGLILQYDDLDIKNGFKPYACIKNYSTKIIDKSFYRAVTITYESTPDFSQEQKDMGKEAFLQACAYYGFPTEGYVFDNDINTDLSVESNIEQ